MLEAEADGHARRVRVVLGGLALLVVVGALVSVGFGAVAISPAQTLAVLAGALGLRVPDTVAGFDVSVTAQQEAVLLAIRLPRVALGLVVGSGLAVSGAMLQGLFRNALADPALVGVSSGAALGAAAAIVVGLAAALGAVGVAVSAFGGGLATTLVVYRIATRRGQTSVTTMLLAGIVGNMYDRMGLPAWEGEWTWPVDTINAAAGFEHSAGDPIYAVRDFIVFRFGTYQWPNFNIADSLLVCGVALMFLHAYVLEPRQRKRVAGQADTETDAETQPAASA